MKKNQIFDIERFGNILRRDLFINQQKIWRIFAATFGSVLIIYLLRFVKIKLTGYSEMNFDIGNMFEPLFYIIGLIISASVFPDFRQQLSTQNFLLIPASKFEKFASSWLITTIGFIVTYLIVFILFNLLTILLGSIFGIHVLFYNFFTNDFWTISGTYLLIQSVFLAGAATFKKSPLVMTPLWIILVSLGLSIALGIVSWIVFRTFGVHITTGNMVGPDINFKALKITGKIILYSTPFVFWAITYFKISEKQA